MSPAERRAQILKAAADVFFERGFAAATIDMIIERIGGSRRAIYNEFGNKEALFAALVTEMAESALSGLSPPARAADDLRVALQVLAESLTTIYMSPSLVGVLRAIVTESYRFPHLAKTFFERGPGRAAGHVQALLDAARDRGEIGVVDTAIAADQFVGMLRDNLHLQVVLGLRAAPDENAIKARAAAATALFLDGLSPATAAPKRRAAQKR